MNNLGIMLIDMQEEFIWNPMPREIIELVESQKKLFNFACEKQIPIFVLEYIDSGKTIDELITTLSKNKTYFLPKYKNDGFVKSYHILENKELSNEQLIEKLDEEKITNLIFTGVNKDACVLATVKNAKNRGYKIFTAEELMNRKKQCEYWYYENSNHYETLTELLNEISKD
jgi:isochorismate hydrolase